MENNARILASALTLGVVRRDALPRALIALSFGLLIGAVAMFVVGFVPPDALDSGARWLISALVGLAGAAQRLAHGQP